MIGIYKITSPKEYIYVGQSINIKKRFNVYKNLKCKRQVRLYRSFLKYGVENHKFEVVIECESSQLNKLERHYQDLYNVISEIGLNCRLTTTDDRTGELCSKTKQKISLAQKGKIFTDQHKLKMSLAKIGIPKSLETKEKMKLVKQNMSDETKVLISLSQKGNKNGRGNKGNKLSPETKEKISIARKLYWANKKNSY